MLSATSLLIPYREPAKRRMSPEDARRAADHAREHLVCDACGTCAGEPCVGPGRSVYKRRFRRRGDHPQPESQGRATDPEQDAVLAALPNVSRAEIEACRTPKGGYSFTRAWFLEHGLPHPPIPGWRHAVEREEE